MVVPRRSAPPLAAPSGRQRAPGPPFAAPPAAAPHVRGAALGAPSAASLRRRPRCRPCKAQELPVGVPRRPAPPLTAPGGRHRAPGPRVVPRPEPRQDRHETRQRPWCLFDTTGAHLRRLKPLKPPAGASARAATSRFVSGCRHGQPARSVSIGAAERPDAPSTGQDGSCWCLASSAGVYKGSNSTVRW